MTVKKSVRQKPRKVGRPVTIAAEKSVTIRLPDKLLDAIDAWKSSGKASRSEAIRELVERGLAAPAPRKAKAGK
jgi:metal-responsive CopG/Arc/MetJ family transcriptional regulator